ncbi:hypothetical protein [Serpentinicella alkaliphila]|nr:hypothetical protein [Serpentinicella alkaliphila]QUH25970.1 hypothetical protein HZR23_09640 [Serpentinicella alkaliphila]
MSKKVIFILISIVTVLVVILLWLIPYIGGSGEFIMHLSDKYHQLDFKG